MNRVVLANERSIAVNTDTTSADLLTSEAIPSSEAVAIINDIRDEENLKVVKLMDDETIIDLRYDQVLDRVTLMPADGDYMVISAVLMRKGTVNPEMADKAAAYDILMGGL